jgi:lactose/L-arabinose transport system substrate-binding protein
MGTYPPCQNGSNYTAPDDFFYKGQRIYKDFAEWMKNVPVLRYTPNYQPMRDAVAHAVLNYFQGKLATIDDTIAAAEAEYKQVMGQ